MAIKPYGAYNHMADAYKALLRLIGQGYHKEEIILLYSQATHAPQGEKADIQKQLLESVSRPIGDEEGHQRVFSRMPQNSESLFVQERLADGAFILLLEITDSRCSL